MLEVKNGVAVMQKTRQLTEKQLFHLKTIQSEDLKREYLLSCLGMVKKRLYVPKQKSYGIDFLKDKREGTVLTKLNRLRNTNADHRPEEVDLGSWVGVEIECFIPHGGGSGCDSCEGSQDCEECGNSPNLSPNEARQLLKQKLSEAKLSRVSIKSDGSLRDENNEGHPVEVTMTFNTKRGFDDLRRLCSVLSGMGCYVNKTCGLHVHLDVRHLEKRQVRTIGMSIGEALPVLKYLVPASRHDNNYCKIGVSPFSGDRYWAVNLTAYRKFKTIEVRLHSGSISFDKIKNWIEIIKIVGAARLTAPLRTFQDLIDLGLTDAQIDYAEDRMKTLNPGPWARVLNPEPLTSEVAA